MESSPSHPLPIPRLRLSRHSPPTLYEYTTAQNTPLTGPLRLPDGPMIDLQSDESDQQHTPKMSSSATTPPLPSAPPADTPAARLRALLSRVPIPPQTSAPYNPAPVSPSEIESDFDPPKFSPTTPSIARESLKDLFSHALRDPGDTPQKGRRRRNSIDVSEVEASPRVARERAKYKSKRRSLSDEEAEKPSRSSQRSESSFRSSQAATFDILRERLTNSHTQLKNQRPPTPPYEQATADDSNDTATFLPDLNSSQATPPAATSTPQRSLQLSPNAQFQSQSNLLEQDSEMHRAMKGFDSYEGDTEPSQRPLSFPSARASNAHDSPTRSRSALSHSKSHLHDKSHVANHLSRRASGDLHRPSSRASSSLSGADYRERHLDEEHDRVREREREWNRPHHRTPARSDSPELHRHSHGTTSNIAAPIVGNGHRILRKGSAASLRTLDDDASSRASSLGSQAEYRDRINELERERDIEREREWNKRHTKVSTSRPTSGLSYHSPAEQRTRTHSHPTRPDSAHSLLSPGRPDLHRHHSFSTSRGSSPSSSLASSRDEEQEHELEVKHEIDHERERNWNAPRPQWHEHPSALGHSHSHSRSTSPMPPSPSSTPASSHLQPPSNGRVRTESLRTDGTTKGQSPIHHTHGRNSQSLHISTNHTSVNASTSSPRAPAHLSHTGNGKQSSSHSQSRPDLHRPVRYPPRPNLPLPPTSQKRNSNVKSQMHASGSDSHFEYQFSRSQTPLPPIEPDQFSPERLATGAHSRTLSSPMPVPRPSSRASESKRTNHIPVRSPKKAQPTSISSGETKMNGHRRLAAESTSHSHGEILPHINVQFLPLTTADEDLVSVTDEEEPPPQDQDGTPTIAPPPIDTPKYTPPRSSSPPPRQRTPNTDEARLQKTLAPLVVLQELSPPPSPPAETLPSHSQPIHSFLSTPPRRPSFNSSRAEFQTPSPPKGLPELPGPPSSEDEKYQQTPGTPAPFNEDARPDLTAMKTPKPPGAWSSTPAPPQQNPPTRAHSLPLDQDDSYDSGLATPVASFSRASSLPPQTPAPPGAWMATPGPRKSILKVRFDTQPPPESEQAVLENIVESSNYLTNSLRESPQSESGPHSEMSPTKFQANRNTGSPVVEETDEQVRTPVPTVPTSPRSLRKSPSMRLVDAFGRERKSEDAGDNGKKERPKSSGVPNTPRNKSAVRIVDAMGREVQNVPQPDNASEMEGFSSLKHNDALVHVRQGLAGLAQGLDHMDGPSDHIQFDRQRLNELEEISRTARGSRERILQTLQMVQNTEGDLRSKFGPFRASMKRSNFLTPTAMDRRLPWAQMNSWIFWGMIFIQILLAFIMYRISTIRARDLFLTTYYDPFYPDLHLYTTKPDTLHHSISSSLSRTSWSIISILDILRRDGWKALAEAIWDNLVVIVSDWQKHAWETWGADVIQQNAPWPPT